MDWQDPTIQEVKTLHDKSDFAIIGVIKAISPEDRKLIYNSLIFKSEFREVYLKEQEPWIKDFNWLWGINHCKEVYEPSRCNDDLLESHELERYRLYYAAKYPERMEIIHINRRTLDYLLETEDVLKVVRSIISMLPNLKD